MLMKVKKGTPIEDAFPLVNRQFQLRIFHELSVTSN